jgi:predicted RNase H-like HicB family nuclease
MQFLVAIEKAENNYAAYVPTLLGCTSTGETIEELTTNIKEAIAGHLAVMQEFNEPLPVAPPIFELFGNPQYVLLVNVDLAELPVLAAA